MYIISEIFVHTSDRREQRIAAERLASLLLRHLPSGLANNEQSHSRVSGRIGVHYEKHAHVQIAAPTTDTAGANPLSLAARFPPASRHARVHQQVSDASGRRKCCG